METFESQCRELDVALGDVSVLGHRVHEVVVELKVCHFVVEWQLKDLRLHRLDELTVQRDILQLVCLVYEPQAILELPHTSHSVLALTCL